MKKARKLLSLVLVFVFSFSFTVIAHEGESVNDDLGLVDNYLHGTVLLGDTEFEVAVSQELRAEVAQIEAELDEFFSNISIETLFNALVEEHPDMPNDELLSWAYELFARYEYVLMFYEKVSADVNADARNRPTNYLHELTRVLSRHDGMSALQIFIVEGNAGIAYADARLHFPRDEWMRDAFRHYWWNFLTVNDMGVNINHARIYTTNHELSANIRRTHGDNINATIVALRNQLFFNRTFVSWDVRFSNWQGQDDAMDLWNNEMGRVDGANHPFPMVGLARTFFDARVAAGTIITHRDQMTQQRRMLVWSGGWYRPVR